MATGTLAVSARCFTTVTRAEPPYFRPPSDNATRTGLRVSSTASMMAWVISMLLVLKAPTPYWPARAALRISSPVAKDMERVYAGEGVPDGRRAPQPRGGGGDRRSGPVARLRGGTFVGL